MGFFKKLLRRGKSKEDVNGVKRSVKESKSEREGHRVQQVDVDPEEAARQRKIRMEAAEARRYEYEHRGGLKKGINEVQGQTIPSNK